MKTLRILSITFVIMILTSCYEKGRIQVQNNISQVKIEDIKWGDKYIATELLPGETSNESSVDGDKLPSHNKLTFKMTANNKSIYLETEEIFSLDQGDKLLIVLTDETKVKNPNE